MKLLILPDGVFHSLDYGARFPTPPRLLLLQDGVCRVAEHCHDQSVDALLHSGVISHLYLAQCVHQAQSFSHWDSLVRTLDLQV